MRAPLGAGKTFFLNTILGRYAREHTEFDERRNCQYILATDTEAPELDDDAEAIEPAMIASDPSVASLASVHDALFADVDGLRVLVVEELDRKANLGQVLWTVASAIRWLKMGGDRLLVLTGDATVSHSRMQEFVATVDARSHIDLEPLELPLLSEALRQRILEKVVTPSAPEMDPSDRAEAADDAVQAILEDTFVRWSAVPATDPNVLATFREALGALRRMCTVAPSVEGRVEFPRELVRTLPQEASAPSGLASDLEKALLGRLKALISSNTPIVPMTMAELAAFTGADPDSRFRRRAVEAVARLGLITPLGTPFEERDERGGLIAIAEPFVPSYRLVHRALAELASA
jgi:hypothetical protein